MKSVFHLMTTSKTRLSNSIVSGMKLTCIIIATALSYGCNSSGEGKGEIGQQKCNIVANPINLNYRFQFNDPSRREAADPVLEYFKGKYYLFASRSGGYWSSEDLCEWTYIPCKSITNIESYAPAILVLDDELYYLGSEEPHIFKTSNPDIDNWEAVETKLHYPIAGSTDPAFFRDDDGRVYLYWGCSNVAPIAGVEVDPRDGFKIIGEAKVLIVHNPDKYGWEVPGENNDDYTNGWNEGPCMIKYKGKYYLHYAAPGTEFRTYGDGMYVSDKPLGPFTYEENSPFSFKLGGFIGGAGHGHTFLDKYGNYWHVATMRLSVRHPFERRLGLFPVYISDDSCMYSHTVFTDFPFRIPQKKTDFENDYLSAGWNLLSYEKKVLSSSHMPGHETSNANDEQVETWWSAKTGKKDEWWQVDLGEAMTVSALQVNFADEGFNIKAPDSYFSYQYIVEYSDNGSKWNLLTDKSKNEKDMPHELIVLNTEVKARLLRITNMKDMEGNFSLSGFRVFGKGNGAPPPIVAEFDLQRNTSDRRIFTLSWNKQDNTTGYVIRWGVKPDKLNNAAMVFDNQFEGRFFNRDSQYYFTIDAFNENSITEGNNVITFVTR